VNSGGCRVANVPLPAGDGPSGLGGSLRRNERGVRRDVLGTAMAGTQGAKARRVSLRGEPEAGVSTRAAATRRL
jgi:hypothetical protein